MTLLYVLLPLVTVLSLSFSSEFKLAFGLLPTKPTFWWYIYWSDTIFEAAGLSLTVALASSIIGLIIGFPVAYLLAKKEFSGKKLLNILVLLPIIFPPFVLGFELVQLFKIEPFNMINPLLRLILAHSIIVAPYIIRPTASALEEVDVNLEEAARSLGASAFSVFWKIDMPLAIDAIIAGFVFALTRSLGDFDTTLYLIEPGYTTLPIEIFNANLVGNSMLTMAVGAVSFILSVLFIIGVEAIIRTRGRRIR